MHRSKNGRRAGLALFDPLGADCIKNRTTGHCNEKNIRVVLRYNSKQPQIATRSAASPEETRAIAWAHAQWDAEREAR